jgi:nanoRNase/pAp phosphatase (c-di-AMP/oligoRNAs hydrolase)
MNRSIESKPYMEGRKMSEHTKHSELKELLVACRGERHIVVLQDFPDPDAISSAFAHKLISAQFEIEVDIVYGRRISHLQNRALVRHLDLQLKRYEESLGLDQYTGAVFVDNQGTTAETIVSALETAGVPTIMVVDHHEAQERLQPKFSDIRKTLGAAATIYTEYLENGLIKMEKSQKNHVMLATALTHGIITDTAGFVRATAEDFHAAAFLSGFRDADLLEKIMNQARSKQTMEIIHQALGNRQVVDNLSIAGIGYLRPEDRDAIPQAADFLQTEDNVHTAIVYGIVTGENSEEMLTGSMRTTKITMDPDEFIKDTFGKDAAGHYFGGGKRSAGGFQIPVGFLAGGHGQDYEDLKWQTYDLQIKQRIFEKYGIEENDNS